MNDDFKIGFHIQIVIQIIGNENIRFFKILDQFLHGLRTNLIHIKNTAFQRLINLRKKSGNFSFDLFISSKKQNFFLFIYKPEKVFIHRSRHEFIKIQPCLNHSRLRNKSTSACHRDFQHIHSHKNCFKRIGNHFFASRKNKSNQMLHFRLFMNRK